ncbi:unnamed protein product [Vitrella brassicaformis CCMP3155]|uniref:Uncharacterized protein n=1 Tax=Vitrella brassicaformis (strain CCMP3155) TaxID=1169540 RepID=A0A0G4ERP2_VITBC|nr:unnamed protein product [Vitrella brassicaformis CCMP3155]|eukprot:CEM00547.1 unnamed protein product [Vitrella brassicaformis CCMP3155]
MWKTFRDRAREAERTSREVAATQQQQALKITLDEINRFEKTHHLSLRRPRPLSPAQDQGEGDKREADLGEPTEPKRRASPLDFYDYASPSMRAEGRVTKMNPTPGTPERRKDFGKGTKELVDGFGRTVIEPIFMQPEKEWSLKMKTMTTSDKPTKRSVYSRTATFDDTLGTTGDMLQRFLKTSRSRTRLGESDEGLGAHALPPRMFHLSMKMKGEKVDCSIPMTRSHQLGTLARAAKPWIENNLVVQERARQEMKAMGEERRDWETRLRNDLLVAMAKRRARAEEAAVGRKEPFALRNRARAIRRERNAKHQASQQQEKHQNVIDTYGERPLFLLDPTHISQMPQAQQDVIKAVQNLQETTMLQQGYESATSAITSARGGAKEEFFGPGDGGRHGVPTAMDVTTRVARTRDGWRTGLMRTGEFDTGRAYYPSSERRTAAAFGEACKARKDHAALIRHQRDIEMFSDIAMAKTEREEALASMTDFEDTLQHIKRMKGRLRAQATKTQIRIDGR